MLSPFLVVILPSSLSLGAPLSWPTLDSLITDSSEPPRWLIENLLPQRSIICLAGMPGVGKSILSYSIAISISSGVHLMGLPSTPGRVLYLDEENGPANQPTYFKWAWKGLGEPLIESLAPNLRIGQNAILSHPGPWLDLLVAEARSFRPNLIIFDTATRCFRIKDENDNAEATRALSALSLIQSVAASDTSILVLKHAKLDHDPASGLASYRMRGASAWAGGSDGVIFHLAPPGNYHGGLRPTYLLPDKTRAFGLKSQLNITPRWTSDDETTRGIELTGAFAA